VIDEAAGSAGVAPGRAAVREAAIEVPALDGYPLAASAFSPDPGPRERVVLIAPATGVRRSVYRHLAGFLAEGGAVVVTWDWRGTGDSRPVSLRGFPGTMTDWAKLDFEGVIRWARREHPVARIQLVGHSFGGQAFGLAPSAAGTDRAATIAAQSGSLRHWPLRLQVPFALLMWVVMPVLARLLGYFPARSLRMGEDLPGGVALEWARWCRSRDYLGDWSGHRRFTVPVLAFSFDDDPIAPRRAVDALHREFGGPVERRHLAPAELGVSKLGHFDFLRPGVAPAVWEAIAAWLDAPAR
jgi:predicted alpha/beta hydrolase